MRIKSAKIKSLTLCPRGKNQLRTLYKSEDGSIAVELLIKASANFDECGEIVACAYPPNHADTDGDWCEVGVCKEMAHGFMQNGAVLDLQHNGQPIPKDKAYIAETFVIQKGDPRFAGMTTYTGNSVDVTGGWGVVIQVDDLQLRKDYRSGAWSGVSLEGSAIADRTPPPIKKEDTNMTPEQLLALSKAIVDGILGAQNAKEEEMKAKLEKAEAAKAAPAAIEFEGDITKAEDVKKHLVKIELSKLDKNDPKAMAAYLAKLEKSEDPGDDGEEDETEVDEIDESEQTPLQKAEAEVKRLKKSSTAPLKVKKSDEATKLAKEDKQALAGADYINQMCGRK